jgi:hypothetical protein
MIELSLPQPEEDAKQAKDLIVSILSREHPLSLIEIYNRIKKERNTGKTYQAVRKAIDLLLHEGVLTKNDKKYAISKPWLLRIKGFADNLLAKYENTTVVHTFTTELAKDKYAIYTFHTLLDLDNFWGDVMTHWLAHRTKKEANIVFCDTHDPWWMLINLGRETTLFENIVKQGNQTYFALRHNTPIAQWSQKLYKDIGVHTSISEKPAPNGRDINVLGDLIIQVEYDAATRQHIRELCTKTKSIDTLSPSAVAKLASQPCKATFVVLRNAEMAHALREQFFSEHKAKKKHT